MTPRAIPLRFPNLESSLKELATISTHALAVLPSEWLGWDGDFGLFEEGKSALSQIEPVYPQDASKGRLRALRAHAGYRWQDGKPLEYEIRAIEKGTQPPPTPLKVDHQDAQVHIDTGQTRFTASLDSESGPILHDDQGVAYRVAPEHASSRITVETLGPYRARVRLEGLYDAGDDRKPLAGFRVWLTACAGSPTIEVIWETTFLDPLKERGVRSISFRIPALGNRAYSYGMERAAVSGAIPPQGITLLASRPDAPHYDGWFSVEGGRGLTLFFDHFHRDYPHGITLEKDLVTVHQWPAQSPPTFTREQIADPRNIHKLLWLHQGVLRTNFPPEAAKVIVDSGELRESRIEDAIAAHAEGVTFSTSFAITDTSAKDEAAREALRGEILVRREIGAQRPIGFSDPATISASQVIGAPMAARAVTGTFARLETRIEDGYLGWFEQAKYGDFGKWLGDGFHEIKLTEKRPTRDRMSHRNHYQECSTLWRLVARGGLRMLPLARRLTARLATIQQSHQGYFWHKGILPWGGEGSFAGHWIDPSALLWSWMIDDRPDHLAAYTRYCDYVRAHSNDAGSAEPTGREPANTFAHVTVAARYMQEPKLTDLASRLAQGLSTAPLAAQSNPTFRPDWLWYDETAKPEFILQGARELGRHVLSLALSALAYRISGEKQILDRHLEQIAITGKGLTPQYGACPMTHDGHLALQWPVFLAALESAGISTIPRISEPFTYPASSCRWDAQSEGDALKRGLLVVALNAEEKKVHLRLDATGMAPGGVPAGSVRVWGPRGEELWRVRQLMNDWPEGKTVIRPSGVSAKRVEQEIPGEAGLYKMRVGGSAPIFQGVFAGLPECCVLQNEQIAGWPEPVRYLIGRSRGYAATLVRGEVGLLFTAKGQFDPTQFTVWSAAGTLLHKEFLALDGKESLTISIPPREMISWDIFSHGHGYCELRIIGPPRANEVLLFGHDRQAVLKIKSLVDPAK